MGIVNPAVGGIASLQAEISKLKRESALRRSFVDIAFRYFVSGERGPDIVIPFETVKSDCSPDWVPGILARPDVHEPEFIIFRHFADPAETILDIGANFGYSAASIWASGSKAAVLSFEPNPALHACLSRMRQLKSGCYDFVGHALGADPSSVKFLIPVIDGAAVSGLTSAVPRYTMPLAAQEHLVSHAMEHCSGSELPTLQFAECEWTVCKLDDALKNQVSVKVDRIPAIKIDVEGFEAKVLQGAQGALDKHRPLVMLENGNRSKDVSDLMTAHGYLYAELENDYLVLNNQKSQKVNGFFLHGSRLDGYRQTGLLR